MQSKQVEYLDGKKNISSMWEAVLQEYQRNGYTIEDAYHQSRLARILREGEYDYKKQEPKLWSYKYEHYRHFEENRKAS